jgi:hypothetical protein
MPIKFQIESKYSRLSYLSHRKQNALAMKTLKPLLYLLLFATLLGCQKGISSSKDKGTQKESAEKKEGPVESKMTEGVLQSFAGTDGCGWMIVTKNETFEPVNLEEFDIALEGGNKIKFSYEKVNGASICMAGTMIRIIKIN